MIVKGGDVVGRWRGERQALEKIDLEGCEFRSGKVHFLVVGDLADVAGVHQVLLARMLVNVKAQENTEEVNCGKGAEQCWFQCHGLVTMAFGNLCPLILFFSGKESRLSG